MTKRLLVAMAVLALGGACGVATRPDGTGGGAGGGAGGGGGSSAVGGSEVRSALSRNTSPTVSQSDRDTLAKDNRDFAFALYRQVRTSAPNVFLSPHSISEALAMAYAGARGDTATQMESALHFSLGQAGLHNAFNELDLALASRGQTAQSQAGVPFRLSVVNALWGQKGYPFEASYLDTLAVNYGAGLRVEDFATAPEPSRQDINAWVAQQTEQKIPELIAPGLITEMTRLVLTNAIYFRAAWAEPFDAANTVDRPFTNRDGTTSTVAMVSGLRNLRAGTGAGFTAAELPYDGYELSMVVVLPDAGQFDAVENALDGDGLKAAIDGLTEQSVLVKLPKFGVESSFMLKDSLTALGMVDAFDASKADFSGLTSAERVFISQVVHKSFIAVDEKGTEAAAATAVIMAGTGMPTQQLDFEVNRPFLFFIRDVQTGAILFMGRVTQL